jgi:ABC-2 type transport system ATP-binding protein
MASQRGRDPDDRSRDGAGDRDRAGPEGRPGPGPRDRDAGRPAIAIEGLTKRFGDGDETVTAVDGVSLSVERGSVVGLLGPNGAGKTTTIKCVLGTVLPDEGSVRIGGVDVHADPRAAYRRVDAMLEGARNDYWRLTVRENLRYFATISGVKPDAVADRHEALLEQLDLAEWADTPVRDLSRGMKQKVSLASVLATDAEVVFLDEPTLGLDVESSLTLRRELRRIVADRGLTVVLSSHDMDVVEDVCDRVVVMSEGRVIADDGVDALLRGFEARGLRVSSRDLDAATVTALRDRVEVTDVRRDGRDGGATVEVATDPEGIYEVMDTLRDLGVRPEAVDTVRPDLAEAFLEMTRGDEDEDGDGGDGERVADVPADVTPARNGEVDG